MAIRINLLEEYQTAEESRRRYRVKRAIWAGVAVVLCFLGWAGWLQARIIRANSELQRHEQAWKSKEKTFQEVTDKQKRLVDTNRKLAALDRFSTNRVLWGNVLNAFQQTVVDNVQMTRLKTDQVISSVETSAGKNKEGKPLAPKLTSIEKTTITVDAKDSGSTSERNYDRFKNAIASLPYFRDQLKKLDAVRLTSLSQPMPAQNDSTKTFVNLTIEITYPEVRRDE